VRPVRIAIVVALALTPALVLAGCVIPGETVELTEMVTETKEIGLGTADVVEVELVANIGTFVIGGGANGLLEADFTYNVAEWKPEVEYSESNGKGLLVVRQPSLKNKNITDEAENRWDIHLTEKVPLTIRLDAGVGDTRLMLDGLTIERLVVDQGVGTARIDFGNEVKCDADVDIDGGVGDIRITVPDDVGIRLDADMGIGSLRAPGLSKSGSAYVNDAYGKAGVNLRIGIDAGIGSVTISGASGQASV